VATFLPREEWAQPRGRKSHQRRCGSDDRGEAGLRPDQAINEATCVRVLNRNLKEKTWRISVVLNKGSDDFAQNEKQSAAKGGIASEGTIEITPLCRGYRVEPETAAAWSRHSEEDCAPPHSGPDHPSFNRPIYVNLFDGEAGEWSSLARGGRKNWLKRFLDHPSRLTRASLRKSGQARPRCAADAERTHAGEDLAPSWRRGSDLG
jgi:hypothetical protein